MDSARPTASLAYRQAQTGIWEGRVPDKYQRLVPHCHGRRALEIGAAEGVLSLLLIRERAVDAITALEMHGGRHAEAQRLQARWQDLGYAVNGCVMVPGDIRVRLDLLAGVDLLIAIRTIYHLEREAPTVLRAAHAAGVARVVLGGNRGRQARHRANPHDALGQFNRLASTEGMLTVLASVGYDPEVALEEGDPVVIGHHPRFA